MATKRNCLAMCRQIVTLCRHFVARLGLMWDVSLVLRTMSCLVKYHKPVLPRRGARVPIVAGSIPKASGWGQEGQRIGRRNGRLTPSNTAVVALNMAGRSLARQSSLENNKLTLNS